MRASEFKGTLLKSDPTAAEILTVVPDYETMVVSIMEILADRYDKSPGYPFIDMKINLMTGEDFDTNDPLKGTDTVYGWIQGRGLEALTEHVLWLRAHPEVEGGAALASRLEKILRDLLTRLGEIRRKNNGHVFFFMAPDGTPLVVDEEHGRRPLTSWSDSVYTFSDLFCAKGMYVAARHLGDDEAAREAKEYIAAVDEAVWNHRFATGEKDVSPEVGPVPVTEVKAEGPFMIHLGTAAAMAHFGDDPEWIDNGIRIIRHILANHVNADGRVKELKPYDYWEYSNLDGTPRLEDGVLLSNAGHSIECVGLGLKFTQGIKERFDCTPTQKEAIADIEHILPKVLLRNFDNGFIPTVGGICLFFDLIKRRPVNANMPWWNLPETLRAAAESWRASTDETERSQCLEVLSACHNAFVSHYVRPELGLMAYQMRASNGEPVAVIPATADADPGYHTGSSVLDFMNVFTSQSS